MNEKFVRQPMTVNLHTHTARCGHASGDDREYVEEAVRGGLKTLGFADHSWYVIRGNYHTDAGVTTKENEDYVSSVLSLRDEYAGVIDIKLGYEADYYPKHFSGLMDMVRRYPIDYLILGPHYTNNEYDGRYACRCESDRSVFSGQVSQIIEAMNTGLFTYVAHPDIMDFADEDVFREEYSRLVIRAKELSIPLEINLLGIRGGRRYPNERFIKLCGELGAKMCIGADAHNPCDVCDFVSYNKALDLAEKYDVEIVYDPKIVSIK